MKGKAAIYIVLTPAFALISAAMVISAFMSQERSGDFSVLWLIAPLTALFMGSVAVNDLLLVPLLLMRRRFQAYSAALCMLALTVPLVSLWLESMARRWLHLQPRISDFASPWILLDSISSSMLLLMILAALGAFGLYERWSAEMRYEETLSERLKSYMATVRSRLQPSVILSMLGDVLNHLRDGDGECGACIRRLSCYLRVQLYELPAPPAVSALDETGAPAYSRFTDFMVSCRYSGRRHLIFQLMLLLISAGTLFAAPDRPELTAERFVSAVGMYLCLNIIAYINILWLIKGFKSNFDVRRYMLRVVVMIVAMLLPIVTLQILTYDQNPYSRGLPLGIQLLSTGGTVVTLTFYVVGVSAALLMKEWILRRRRIVLLHAETVRQEYSFLRKQINPHFLFNVLNTIDILSVDDRADAISMSEELLKLLEYQLAETGHYEAALSEEIDSLRRYLLLEGMRLENFSFDIRTEGDIDRCKVPTLLFIPIVENAVKHGRGVDGLRYVRLRFEVEGGRLLFVCENPYSPESAVATPAGGPLRPGGLGLFNTRRRLELLYAGDFTFESEKMTDRYIARMDIPVG